MKFVKYIVAAVVAAVAFMGVEASAQSLSKSTTWHWDKGTIVVDTPERPEGQEHVVGLAVEPIERLRVGFVGLGMRGPWAVMRFVHIPGVEVVALCDYERERADACQRFLYEASMAMRRCASAKISTLYTSLRTGITTSPWRSTPWSMASMWRLRCPRR